MGTTTYTPSEVRWGGPAEQFMQVPVTVKKGTALVEGTILGKITADGLYREYDDGDSPAGVGLALGILAENVDPTDENIRTSMYVRGNFVESLLTGLDANGKGDLGSRSLAGHDILIL